MDLHGSSVSVVLVVVVSVVLSVGAVLLLQPTRTEAGTVPAITIDTDRLDDLEKRLDALERTTSMVRTAAPVESAMPDREPIDRSADLLSLAKIEKRLTALEERNASGALSMQLPFLDYFSGVEEIDIEDAKLDQALRRGVIAAARRTITDRNTSVQDKVNAHGSLRGVKDAYTPEMAHEMIQIGLHNADAAVRAQVWTIFDGGSAASIPALIPNLLGVLNADKSGRVRQEAAETLGNFPHDRDSIFALEYAAKNDPDPSVRRKATRTLLEMKAERDARRSGR